VVDRLSDYQGALGYLFARTTGITRLGLERTDALLDSLGNPHDRLVCFHIAGTNGKGSVAAVLEALLREQGLRVGKYTSPHLVDFRERIVIDGGMISAGSVVAFVHRWTPLVEKLGCTFFEATTAMAFDLLDKAEVDVAIIETGLGGRLDSTNVIVPRVSIVTNIGLDHTEYLGETREEIAREKGGIFKRGVPAVIGEPNGGIRALLAGLASAAGSSRVVDVPAAYPVSEISISAAGTAFRLERGGQFIGALTGLHGEHQASNAAVAIAALDAAGTRYAPSPSSIAEALPGVRLPGRFQRRDPFIFDVAHNPDGALMLARCIKAVLGEERVATMLCVLADKDWRGMIRALAPVSNRFLFTNAPTAPASRRWDLVEVAAEAERLGLEFGIEADFDAALQSVSQPGGRVLITGSFHTVGDAMTRLQPSPLPG
jgi:dihydrofolate synthase/folylpolyglutamate synthase